MSTRPPNDSIGPLDQLSMRYLRQALDVPHPTDEPYVLNDVESRVIRRIKIVVLTMTASLSALGVLLFYLPQYSWPDLFGATTLFVFDQSYELSFIPTLYGLLLVYLGVNALLIISEWGVKMIMEVCQFPGAHDAQYEQHLQTLAAEMLKTSRSGFFRLGLDSYLTMPRWGLPIFFLLSLVKAFLVMLTLQLLAGYFSGLYNLRIPIDILCILTCAFWTSRASWQVLQETQIRVMAPITIREFLQELHDEWGKDKQFFFVITEALHYTAITRRPVNYARFLLIDTINDLFDLTPVDLPGNNYFPDRLSTLPPTVCRSLERLVVFTSLVDGRLSGIEKKRLNTLRKKGFLTYSAGEIQRISTNYNQGRGLWV